jgi:type IV secretory pathway VirD2 relaxase
MTMNRRDDNRFRAKPAAPSGKQPRPGERFTMRVLRGVSRAGGLPLRTKSTKARPTLARLGRGAGAAAFAGSKLGPRSRRVVVKSRIVNLKRVTPQAVDAHLRYIARGGVGHDGQPTQPYGPETDSADWHEFAAAGRKDRHQFRLIVSPEDGARLTDLRDFTRELMSTTERDLATDLEWIAVDHWDTDNPHTHVVLRGKDEWGKDLIIARQYLTDGMRLRACELSTRWLGPRTEIEILETLKRDVSQEAWTGLDRQLQALARSGGINLARPNADVEALQHRNLLRGRLQALANMGLAREQESGIWELSSKAEATLRALGERGDIIRTMHRALRGQQRELALFDADPGAAPIVGRIVAVGYLDELEERAYAVVDGIDGRAHHVPIGQADLNEFPVGGIVEVRPTPLRAADRNVAALSKEGVYLTEEHRARLRAQGDPRHDPDEIVDAYERRLEALRRAGIVERETEGIWRIPPDLVARGHAYDRQRTGGVDAQLHSHLPIDRLVTTMGATWLDRTLVNGDAEIANAGFGTTVKEALRKRVDFLIEHGFAKRDGDHLNVPPDLLTALRERDLNGVAKELAAETGMVYRPLVDDGRTTGVYRRMVVATSGRFAMLDDGVGFSLVPWRPVLEQRVGQRLSATLRGDHVTWSFGRQRGLSR